MNQADSYTTVTPRTARKFIMECIFSGLVPYVTASPGIGKSAIYRSIAEELGLLLIDHRLSSSIPEDMNGLAKFNADGEAIFTPFTELFPIEGMELPDEKEGWMLLLDELPSAEPDVLKAAYKLILDKMVGQKKLHERVIICAAGNLASDRAIVNFIGTALQSRVIHIHMVSDTDEWIEDVAIPQYFDHRIIAFLQRFPQKLNDFNPKHTDKTFCCERTWEFMHKLIQDESPEHLQEHTALYAGTISSYAAVEFVQFCQVYKQINSVEEILKDPDTATVPHDMNLAWATISSLSNNITEKTFAPMCTYVNRFSLSFRILFFRIVMLRFPELRRHSAFIKSATELSQYLHG